MLYVVLYTPIPYTFQDMHSKIWSSAAKFQSSALSGAIVCTPPICAFVNN